MSRARREFRTDGAMPLASIFGASVLVYAIVSGCVGAVGLSGALRATGGATANGDPFVILGIALHGVTILVASINDSLNLVPNGWALLAGFVVNTAVYAFGWTMLVAGIRHARRAATADATDGGAPCSQCGFPIRPVAERGAAQCSECGHVPDAPAQSRVS